MPRKPTASHFGTEEPTTFAPDREDFLAQVVPKPGTLCPATLGVGLALLVWRGKREHP
jgi:hypothetical protein